MAPASGPEISVVIPTYQRPDYLTRCLQALAEQSLDPSRFEVVVIDDASGPQTPAALQSMADTLPNLSWHSHPTNRGPAVARNTGVKHSTAPLILFIDDDILATPTLVETHLERHADQPDLLAIAGRVTWDPNLSLTDFMRWLEDARIQWQYAEMTPGPQSEIWSHFHTCNVSLSRAAFDAVGGFDEGFPSPVAYEDCDLGARLAENGLVLDYQPEALAFNARPSDLRDVCRTMRGRGPSMLRFTRIHPELGIDPLDHRPTWRRTASTLKRQLLRAVTTVAPSARDLQVAYWDSAVSEAYAAGIRDGLRER